MNIETYKKFIGEEVKLKSVDSTASNFGVTVSMQDLVGQMLLIKDIGGDGEVVTGSSLFSFHIDDFEWGGVSSPDNFEWFKKEYRNTRNYLLLVEDTGLSDDEVFEGITEGSGRADVHSAFQIWESMNKLNEGV